MHRRRQLRDQTLAARNLAGLPPDSREGLRSRRLLRPVGAALGDARLLGPAQRTAGGRRQAQTVHHQYGARVAVASAGRSRTLLESVHDLHVEKSAVGARHRHADGVLPACRAVFALRHEADRSADRRYRAGPLRRAGIVAGGCAGTGRAKGSDAGAGRVGADRSQRLAITPELRTPQPTGRPRSASAAARDIRQACCCD